MKHFPKNLFVVSLAAAFYVSAPAARADTEKWIELHNRTSSVIMNVYFGETWSTSFSRDALEGVIGQDATKVVRILSGACMVDMRVRYANNARHDLRLDICQAEHVDAMPTGLNVARYSR